MRPDPYIASLTAAVCILVPACDRSAAPPVTDLTVVGTDFSYEAPDSIPAGFVRVRLDDRGPTPHHLVVLRVPTERSAEEALTAIATTGSVPEWLESVGGPEVSEEPARQASFISYFEPGEYVLACVLLDDEGVPHYRHGMVRGLVVGEPLQASTVGPEPATDTIIFHDHYYEVSGPLRAGHVRFWVENQGTQRHHAEIVKLNDGVDFETLVNALSDFSAPQPLQSAGGTTGLSPGRSGWLEVNLEAGSYALVCFFVDGDTGLPHFRLSMVRMFEVT